MKTLGKCIVSLFMGATALAAGVEKSEKPSWIVILTDDQDMRMDSMDYLPKIKKHLTDESMFFNHHYATVALCCPSRASMWTGKAAHNTNVTNLKPPYGGYPKFIEEKLNKKWLPVFLKDAGYQTYYTGKLMNTHTEENYRNGLDDLGLTGHDFMIEPGTYQYLNTTLQHNMEDPKPYPGLYATDLLANVSLGWIDEAVKSDDPFFLAINPVNPHNNQDGPGGAWTPPIPAKRHENDFADVKVPRNGNFNPDEASGASWVKELEPLTDEQIDSNDNYYRRRLQALQSVDDLVESTVERLQQHGVLDNTFIIYTSDNGFHISQHRLTPDEPWEHVQVEHWGLASDKANISLAGLVNTYKAARSIGPDYNLYYAVWCEGDHEVYDMTDDPYQMNNLYNSTESILGVSTAKLEDRLDAVLLVLKTCAGSTCRQPWAALHPEGGVKTLKDPLDPKYDTFYENQNKVQFAKCEKGYHVNAELPIDYQTYGNKTTSVEERDEGWWNAA